MTDDFKYKNLHHYPTATGRIVPSKRGDPLAVKLDTAGDVLCSFCGFSKAFYQAAEEYQ